MTPIAGDDQITTIVRRACWLRGDFRPHNYFVADYEEQGSALWHLAEHAKNNWNMVAMLNNDMIRAALSSRQTNFAWIYPWVTFSGRTALEPERNGELRKACWRRRRNDWPTLIWKNRQTVCSVEVVLNYADRFLLAANAPVIRSKTRFGARARMSDEDYTSTRTVRNGIQVQRLPRIDTDTAAKIPASAWLRQPEFGFGAGETYG